MLSLELFTTGYCVASEHHILRGGAHRAIHCHALVGLIRHPRHGPVLFDTGYARRMLTATSRWPYRIYRYLLPMQLRPELEAVAQLRVRGLAPETVRMIILSHMHADHIAGLVDFPQARVVLTVEALLSVHGAHGLAALRAGNLPGLLPADLADRATLLPAFGGPPLPHLGPTHDLFGDGSLLLVALPGHARGQIGALVASEAGPVLLAADGAWTRRSFRELRPPDGPASLLADDRQALNATLAALHAFSQARPEVRIVPTHCPEAFAELTTTYASD